MLHIYIFLKAILQVNNVKLLPMTIISSCPLCTDRGKVHTQSVRVCEHGRWALWSLHHGASLPIVSQPFTGSRFLLQREITNTNLELQIEWWMPFVQLPVQVVTTFVMVMSHQNFIAWIFSPLLTPVYGGPICGWVYGLLAWIKTTVKVDQL